MQISFKGGFSFLFFFFFWKRGSMEVELRAILKAVGFGKEMKWYRVQVEADSQVVIKAVEKENDLVLWECTSILVKSRISVNMNRVCFVYVSRRENRMAHKVAQYKKTSRSNERQFLTEWSSAAAATVSDKERDKEKEKEDSEHAASNGEMCDKNVSAKSSDIKKNIQAKKDFPGSDADSNTEALEPMSISVPDPDFHDFDKDRSERSFGETRSGMHTMMMMGCLVIMP
uniref:RNase H type-1 domain-containing protein n=1 Tax=Nelumbo nucifera TaxID=4432 RepID=A0A822XNF6_NELNU|nr:TPA_asm: hypothetical protein HUJ06_023260 [Nelumbo nucifera]